MRDRNAVVKMPILAFSATALAHQGLIIVSAAQRSLRLTSLRKHRQEALTYDCATEGS